MVLHFAPNIEQSYENPYLTLELQESRAVLAEAMGKDTKGNNARISVARFYIYIDGNVGRSNLPLDAPKRRQSTYLDSKFAKNYLHWGD